MNLVTVLERLRAEGLTTATAAADDPAHSPWYVRAMLGFCGWIAGILIVAFFGVILASLFREGVVLIAIGIALCVVASAVYRWKTGDLVEQFALAMSLAGQFMVAFGLGEALTWKDRSVAGLLVAFQVALVVLMPNFLHRLLSTLFAATALYYALDKTGTEGIAAGVLSLGFAALWVNETRWRASRHASMFCAIAWGVGIAVLAWDVPPVVREISLSLTTWRVLETAGYGVGLIYFVAASSAAAPLRLRAFALVAAGALVIAASPAPGIVAGILVLIAGFRAGVVTLVGLAIAGVIGYLSAYYYQLDQSLLVKAGALAGTGAVLLLARFGLMRAWPAERVS
ncbi:DUF4401 domain-containing protein [Usitatibacter palustris]|uniref:DUF4401 domain-containing protein n=1 Tax=Usitatibacter palustris TaxID=2732487 RepID=A0A6M4H5S8_9PROT|nr:DUF4401 domain-containing protein [Usitatibacter palustris]QJR14652.1 hypothetical protein DSM104440_01462 [Usitatibacter palustris]